MSSLFEKLGAEILARMFEVAAHGLAVLDDAGGYLHINARGCAILGREYEPLRNERFLAHIAPAQTRRAQAWFEASLRGAIATQDFAIVRPDGSECEVSAFCVPVELEARLCGLLALHDVTESRRAEREAKLLASLASRLSLKTSVYAIAEQIAAWVVETTTGLACAVLLVNEGVGPRLVGARGFVVARLSREVLERLSELERPWLLRDPVELQAFDETVEGARLGALACVPLIHRGVRSGVLLCAYASAPHADEEALAFLQAVADQSVFALENARLFFAAQDKAALEERQRLARELHDSVSQALYSIALGARSARSQLGQHPERVAERLDYVLKLAEAAMTEMRALIFELRPEVLASEGLIAALHKQAAALRARHHLEVDASFGDEPALPLGVKEAFYRIAQEALHNVVKHARATRVTLELDSHDAALRLVIRDDGVGFDPSADFSGHFGLSSMRERAELVGGTFQLESRPGVGATLTVTVPLQAE